MAETIGQQLKEARAERHLTIEDVAASTRIRAHYIEAIEADDFESLPSPVQARAFLRLYAGHLGLSLDELIARQASQDGAASPLPIPATPAAPVEEPPVEAEALPVVTQEEKRGLPKILAGLISRLKGVTRRFRRKSPAEPGKESEPQAKEPEPASEPMSETVETAPADKKEAASQAVFTAIGESLRQRREMLSLTLEEVERNIHIRTHYLVALETGDFNHLPSSVQGRGMLNNYAHFLDMDVEALLLQYAEGLQVQRIERQPQPVEMSPKQASKPRFTASLPPGLRRFLSMDILVGGGLVVLLLAFAIYGTSRIIGLRGASTPQATAPSISDILGNNPPAGNPVETPTPEANSTGEANPPSALETSAIYVPPEGPGVVHVVVVALQSAWVRVTVDGKVQFEGRINPGTAYPYDGETQIEVITGNGAAVSILYNESDLGAMGAIGEVVDHIYTADSILNPTPTFTPSPTITPKPSITPRPSPTVRPTRTPKQ